MEVCAFKYKTDRFSGGVRFQVQHDNVCYLLLLYIVPLGEILVIVDLRLHPKDRSPKSVEGLDLYLNKYYKETEVNCVSISV